MSNHTAWQSLSEIVMCNIRLEGEALWTWVCLQWTGSIGTLRSLQWSCPLLHLGLNWTQGLQGQMCHYMKAVLECLFCQLTCTAHCHQGTHGNIMPKLCMLVWLCWADTDSIMCRPVHFSVTVGSSICLCTRTLKTPKLLMLPPWDAIYW